MEQDEKNEVDDHQDQGPNGGLDAKQSDQTDDGEVDSSCRLLQRAGVDETLGVDRGIEHVQHVVAISQVDQIKAYGCKPQDQRCNDRVGNGYRGVSCATHLTMDPHSPITVRSVYTGKTVPQLSPEREENLLYIFLGVLSRNLPKTLYSITPTNCTRAPELMVRP